MGKPQDTPLSQEEFVEHALAEFERPLVAYAMGFVHDLERARDVVQDTFIRLYQQDRSKVERSLKAWLFTVCRNRALDVLRKEKRMVELSDERLAGLESEAAGPGVRADWDERVGQVMKALERLSENQREVIRLKFQQGLSYKEISALTGLTTGNVGFQLHAGLKRLRSLLPPDLLDNLNSNRPT
ncbi:MAG: sigma-70 family RNA polymerase sigma factor [Akkermansiaceae bacterium]|nr:sigma-70 family RNA polymerase sigma factor [Akkermansiaceae bacterium]NNM28445.1 sigma-70 family RNA polymerase sigma factor [Akkermansiaceae bacterium]